MRLVRRRKRRGESSVQSGRRQRRLLRQTGTREPYDRRDHRLLLEVQHRPRLARQLPRVQLDDHGLVLTHLEEASLAVGGCYFVAHGKGLLGQGGLLQEAVHGRAVRQLPAV
eukprot:scaffold1061_cov153-Pinguiococcus_pyrenoidosus.AAC.1